MGLIGAGENLLPGAVFPLQLFDAALAQASSKFREGGRGVQILAA